LSNGGGQVARGKVVLCAGLIDVSINRSTSGGGAAPGFRTAPPFAPPGAAGTPKNIFAFAEGVLAT
jgi:hypothetical protein